VDWAAGIAVNALGHSDEALARVISAQARKIQHVSNLFHTREPLLLAKALADSSQHLDKVFLCNSGTEANEAALKFAKKASLVKAQREALAKQAKATGAPAPAATAIPAAFDSFSCKSHPCPTECFTKGGMCGCWPQASDNAVAARYRHGFVAFKGGFHGRSMGSLSVTHKPQIRYPFGPFPADVSFAYYNETTGLEQRITESTAAVIVEPVQGEGGIFPADAGFLRALRQRCDETGALLIVDEVQCGLGRTGRLWAHEAYEGFKPDMMTLAKPLAGGLPVGAVLVTNEVASCIRPGDHGTTFGGNPFVASAALSVFERIADPAFLARTREMGAFLVEGLERLRAKYPGQIAEVRCAKDRGLFVGLQLTQSPKALVQKSFEAGLLLITAGTDTIRICPPLIITKEELQFGIDTMDKAFAEIAAQKK
jgi:acetylornithine aminotransferase